MKTIEVHTIESLFDSDKESDNRKVILVNDLKLAKIVIEVRGGIVQAVYTNPALKSIPVTVIDYDNHDPKTLAESRIEDEIEQGKLKSIL